MKKRDHLFVGLEALVGSEKLEIDRSGKAAELQKEISVIAKGRSLEDLELSDLKEILNRYGQMESILGISGKGSPEIVQKQMDMAKKIMGEEFFGFQEVKKASGIEINPEDIPEIPFGKAELKRAKELKQFLVLRVDKTPDGKPLSLQKISEILKDKVSDGSKLQYLDNAKNRGIKSSAYEDFIKNETPKSAWALVSKEVIANSTGKNYLQQTEELAGYIKNHVFKGSEIPEEYREAIKEFEKEKDGIRKIISSDWQKASERLSRLKINQLTRQNPAEVFYDIAVYFQNKGERILKNMYTWTSSRGSSGELVGVGDFDADGVYGYRWVPDDTGGDLGVAFSRRL